MRQGGTNGPRLQGDDTDPVHQEIFKGKASLTAPLTSLRSLLLVVPVRSLEIAGGELTVSLNKRAGFCE
jgi:hypothetical protein